MPPTPASTRPLAAPLVLILLIITAATAIAADLAFTRASSSVEHAVSGAPSDCDNGSTKTLTTLAITGPATVAESSSATYAATAGFSDGTTQNVTAAAAWSGGSAYASIAGGVLTTSPVTGDQPVTIGASYSTASCHSAKTGTFTFIHDKHVTDKKLDCSNCHTFTKG